MTTERELLNAATAAQHLHSLDPARSAEQWVLWLQNNRNPARPSPYRVPFTKLGGGVFYAKEDLDGFAEYERGRKLGAITLTGRAAEVVRAMGIGSPGGSTTGRTLEISSLLGQVDEYTKLPFVQFMIAAPFLVYRLDPEQARAVARDLLSAANDAEQEAARHAR